MSIRGTVDFGQTLLRPRKFDAYEIEYLSTMALHLPAIAMELNLDLSQPVQKVQVGRLGIQCCLLRLTQATLPLRGLQVTQILTPQTQQQQSA